MAHHLSLDMVVAVKFIVQTAQDQSDARKRFEREAKAAALLKSPHVVQIHDYGVEGENPYMVMELLQGEDLAQRLADRVRLSADETVDIVTQVSRALRRAAEAGIVHRDLKPGNVFLCRSEDDHEIVKVLDFGAAKAPRLITLQDDTTKAGMLIGSPRYMSPEQARASHRVDHRSDLWSLAVIAYRALTGQPPFLGEDIGEIIVRICTESAPPPSSIYPLLSPDIDAFFERALDRNPDKRYQTARELAAALAEAAGIAPAPSQRFSRLDISNMLSVPPPPSSRQAVDLPTRRATPLPLEPAHSPAPPSEPVTEKHRDSTPSGTLLEGAKPAPLRRPATSKQRWSHVAGVAAGALLAGSALLTWRVALRAPDPPEEIVTALPATRPPPPEPAVITAPVVPAASTSSSRVEAVGAGDAGAPVAPPSASAPAPLTPTKRGHGRKHSIFGI